VHTTCYSDVLHSLLQCNSYYKEWNTKFGPTHGRQSDVMTQERRRWSIVSKSARGLYLLDADLKREFRREGVNPTGKCMNLFHSAVYAGYTFLITTHTLSRPPPFPLYSLGVAGPHERLPAHEPRF